MCYTVIVRDGSPPRVARGVEGGAAPLLGAASGTLAGGESPLLRHEVPLLLPCELPCRKLTIFIGSSREALMSAANWLLASARPRSAAALSGSPLGDRESVALGHLAERLLLLFDQHSMKWSCVSCV
jgi:hypothetical protein